MKLEVEMKPVDIDSEETWAAGEWTSTEDDR